VKFILGVFFASSLLISAFYDLRTRRIPNVLTFSAILTGTGLHTAINGFEGFMFSISGMFIGIGLLIIFYLMGGMGAGDVKLMGAVGSYLGPEGVFVAFLCTAIVGGIYSIAALAASHQLRGAFRSYGFLIKSFIITGQMLFPPPHNEVKKPVLCYGIAIAIGSLLSLIYKPL
jgi:prepilin peptidase CpaA